MNDYSKNFKTYRGIMTWKEIVEDLEERLIDEESHKSIARWLAKVARKKVLK